MFPTILDDIFASRATPYNLRNRISFKMRKFYSAYNDAEALSHLGPEIWSTRGNKAVCIIWWF